MPEFSVLLRMLSSRPSSAVILGSVLLGAFLVLSSATMRRESTTYDEPVHITSGYVYAETGHYFLDPIHPPLFRLWLALPWIAQSPGAPWPPPREIVERRIGLPDYFLH